MIASRKRYLTAFAATSMLALGLYGCGGGGGPTTMMPEPDPEPDAAAVANAINLVASWATKDADGNTLSGWWWRDEENDSGNQENLSHTHRVGSTARAVISYDANGPQFNIAIVQNDDAEPLQTDPGARAHRYINTYDIGKDLEGVTTSRDVITDHGLGSEWHVEELKNDYENAGFLEIGVATDVKSTDGAIDQWETASDVPHNILLDGAPSLPAGRDFLVVWFGNGETIDGSLGGVEGSFTCDRSENCWFFDDREMGDFYAGTEGISFTPDGGTAEPVPPGAPGPTGTADYLAFGYWYYQPEDVAVAADYDFGVFASGGDPFEASNLAGLTGSATYAGSAMGAFYVGKSSASPTYGLFNASVALTANFGDGTETGAVSGTIDNFDWPAEVEALLPATVTLTSDNWKGNTEAFGHNYTYDMYEIVRGESNIFDTPWPTNSDAYHGGVALGRTEADVGGTYWQGEWSSAFFGNGASATDHPTSMAGTFIASDQAESGLAGSFGAHKQE